MVRQYGLMKILDAYLYVHTMDISGTREALRVSSSPEICCKLSELFGGGCFGRRVSV